MSDQVPAIDGIAVNVPAIAIGGSASGGGGSSAINDVPITIEQSWAQLIASGSDFFQGTGATIFNMDAGTISTASTAQIGRVVNGVTITAQMVQQNQLLLNGIGAYCRANGIAIHVEAQLDLPPSGDWTYQWLAPAKLAGLPITGVENDDEVTVSDGFASFPTVAQYMVGIVTQIVADYPNVQIGQWQGGNPAGTTALWWEIYDVSATVAHLPTISYAVADTSWNAPWETSPANWQAWFVDLSNLAKSNGVQLEVLLDGVNTDASDQQWTAQSEQHAAMVATLSGVSVSTILVRTWQSNHPQAVLPLNSPTTIGNDVIEIAATYPLYQNGLITAQGPITLSAAPQMIVRTGSVTTIGSMLLHWDTADLTASTRIAVVLLDSSCLLAATASGDGTVSGTGTNELVLNGTYGEVAAELASLSVTATASGPDTIDIQLYGANGRLYDAQISVLSLPSPLGAGSQNYTFQPSLNEQSWTSASATVSSSEILTSTTFSWNAIDGTYQLINSIGVYEPLAETDVTIINGVPQATGASGSTPLNGASWNASAFNPAGLRVTATDTSGLAVSETFTATVVPAAPAVTAQTTTQSWQEGKSIALALAANTFTDPQGQNLTYTASQSNGQPLPSWLTFNAATETFSGTAAPTAQSMTLRVTATDTSGLAVSETFTATVAPAAPAVTAQTTTQSWQQGKSIALALAANTFTDPQGQNLTYTASQSNGQPLPSWLTFNAATETFSGTAPLTAQSMTLRVTATDTSGLAVSETFTTTVAPAAPAVTAQTTNQSWQEGKSIALALAANTFTDPQGQNLTYTASQSNGQPLPGWLTFNAANRSFNGTAPLTAQSLTLKVIATDTSGLAVSETFTTTVAPAAPAVTAQTTNQSWQEGKSIALTLAANTFTDPQGQKLTYTASQSNGQPLPSWLTFNAANRSFSGTTPLTAQSLTLKVTATDTSGLAVSETFTTTVAPAAPAVTAQTTNQSWQEGKSIALALSANTFTDPQGQKLTYTASQSNGQPLPSWLTFNAANRSFSGTTPLTAQSLTLKVTATDASGLAVSETFTTTVAPAAPVVTAQTTTQSWQEGKSIALALAANTFTDPQGQKLTYTASQSNGQPLPSWLIFNAATETFSGTAPLTAQSMTLRVTATDTSGLAVSETFTATVTPPVVKPGITASATPSQTWTAGQNVDLVLPGNMFTDALGLKMAFAAYEASGPNIISWLKFNPTTDEFTGKVPTTASGSAWLAVVASDAQHMSAADLFSVTFTAGSAQSIGSSTGAAGIAPSVDVAHLANLLAFHS